MNIELIQTYLRDDKLLVFPQKRKPRIASLCWLSKQLKTNTLYTLEELENIIKGKTLFSNIEVIKKELLNNKFISFDKEKNAYIKENKQPKFDDYGFKED